MLKFCCIRNKLMRLVPQKHNAIQRTEVGKLKNAKPNKKNSKEGTYLTTLVMKWLE